MGFSVSSVQRVWSAHGLRPHLMRRFKLSNDPQFATKLKEIVGQFVSPPDRGWQSPALPLASPPMSFAVAASR
jgi:hypothetical protein